MRDAILDMYRNMAFTPFENRGLVWLNELINNCASCPLSDDETANYMMGGAICELKRIRTFVLDLREFPELDNLPMGVACLAPIIVSFIRADQDFIYGGYVFVLREFIYPLAKWHYCLYTQINQTPFREFMIDREDVGVLEMLQPLRFI
jgi:hypothetical protein